MKRKFEYVSINGHTIRKNAVAHTDEPPIRIARTFHDRAPRYAHAIRINGPSELIYNAEQAILGCGARLVLKAQAGSVEVVR